MIKPNFRLLIISSLFLMLIFAFRAELERMKYTMEANSLSILYVDHAHLVNNYKNGEQTSSKYLL